MNRSPRTTNEATLPRDWPKMVKTGLLQVISLARYAAAYTRGWAADSRNARVRLKAENDRLEQEVALLREELRIKDARLARIDPHHRPHYPPTERLAILELKAARQWSLEQTARAMFITAATVTVWLGRLEEDGPAALVQLPRPVNKYPDFVKHVTVRLKRLVPSLGKVKLAQILARAGLHLGVTTVARMLAAKPTTDPVPDDGLTEPSVARPGIIANYPNHVWTVDLTAVPTGAGLWCPWRPFALPQRWPFCWWLAVVVDHFSRRAMGAALFKQQPTSEDVRAFLGRAITKAKTTFPRPRPASEKKGEGQGARAAIPRYIVCDRGPQFDCRGFRDWCKRKGIKPPRYGALGKHGSIAVTERFILTLKCLLRCLLMIPYGREAMRREVTAAVEWYNRHRPHTWLGGRTPDEVYFNEFPAHRKPRLEPRPNWPRGSPCARPWALVRGSPGTQIEVEVTFYHGRKQLPVVTIRRAA